MRRSGGSKRGVKGEAWREVLGGKVEADQLD